jgi:hypothetical protein
MTVSRAQEGTTAHSWSAGDKVSMFPTAGTMQNLAQINGYGANGNWNINAATATTATNQSGGTVNATTINSSGNVVSGGNVTVNGGNLQVGSSAGNYVDINFTGQLSIQGGSFNQLVTVNQFGSNWAINGYQYLPNGFLIQWGQSSVHTSGIFSFPISFPNACVAMSLNDGYAGVHVMSGSAINNSQFAAYTNPNDTNFFFIALGY